MAKERVLLIEKQKKLIKRLQSYLASQEYEVLIATQATQVLTICKEKSPQIILLDISIPNIQICFDSLNTKSNSAYIPIIYLIPDKNDVNYHIPPQFADDYIHKPLDFEELNIRIKAALHRINRR